MLWQDIILNENLNGVRQAYKMVTQPIHERTSADGYGVTSFTCGAITGGIGGASGVSLFRTLQLLSLFRYRGTPWVIVANWGSTIGVSGDGRDCSWYKPPTGNGRRPVPEPVMLRRVLCSNWAASSGLLQPSRCIELLAVPSAPGTFSSGRGTFDPGILAAVCSKSGENCRPMGIAVTLFRIVSYENEKV